MIRDEIALFPLKTVLCPAGRLPLKIFEPRYLDMVARCLKQATSFGVVAIRSGSEVGQADTYDVGTAAQIEAFSRREDGLLGLIVRGGERFRLRSVSRRDDGLYSANVEWLAAEAARPLPDAHRPLADFLRAGLDRLDGGADESVDAVLGDAVWVGFRLTELLPLELAARQSLLEMQDPLARLEALAPVVARLREAFA
jgi:Lon protease-like protein